MDNSNNTILYLIGKSRYFCDNFLSIEDIIDEQITEYDEILCKELENGELEFTLVNNTSLKIKENDKLIRIGYISDLIEDYNFMFNKCYGLKFIEGLTIKSKKVIESMFHQCDNLIGFENITIDVIAKTVLVRGVEIQHINNVRIKKGKNINCLYNNERLY